MQLGGSISVPMINHNQGTGEVFFPLSCNFTPTSPNFAGWAVVDQSQPGSLKWSYNQYQGWDPTKLPPKDPSTNTDFRPYWIDQLFDSGHIALTPPDLSTGTITCQTIGVWQINSPGSQPFTDSRRSAPLQLSAGQNPTRIYQGFLHHEDACNGGWVSYFTQGTESSKKKHLFALYYDYPSGSWDFDLASFTPSADSSC